MKPALQYIQRRFDSIKGPLAFVLVLLLAFDTARAQENTSKRLTQEQVFGSIRENVGGKTDSGKFLGFAAIVVAVVILIALLSQRQRRAVSPKPLNSQSKLLREILQSVPLKSGDVKRLKAMAEKREIESPLTLLLCPSVLGRSHHPVDRPAEPADKDKG